MLKISSSLKKKVDYPQGEQAGSLLFEYLGEFEAIFETMAGWESGDSNGVHLYIKKLK
jgi:hypothetical protein